ncbi:hypothetical protein FA09DRAFT_206522 [Tilletiopsis washingtonensis]|uniref:Uncharacterized protein n=1 Tax=Tilletiopsis washingtonensis TaxID=58919 RepID=A0A316ZFU8_9BASI|nr:hypothetical protein FA09DRAFT_206522 [Tilletiopsis washingtonensis]PWO00117.1 hypothetical protein FA09DRAFT_206522 [Tilletiopsis washingtonensis]
MPISTLPAPCSTRATAARRHMPSKAARPSSPRRCCVCMASLQYVLPLHRVLGLATHGPPEVIPVLKQPTVGLSLPQDDPRLSHRLCPSSARHTRAALRAAARAGARSHRVSAGGGGARPGTLSSSPSHLSAQR